MTAALLPCLQVDLRQSDSNAAPIVLTPTSDVPYVAEIMAGGRCFRSKGSLQVPVPSSGSYSISVMDLKTTVNEFA